MNGRILVLNWRDIKNQHAGGAEVYAHETGKRFVQEGFQVTWFASRTKNLPSYEETDGIRIIRHGTWITVYVWAFFYYIFKLHKECDAIIDCQNGIPFFTPLYSSKKIISLIHHVHRQVFKYHSPNFLIKYGGIFLESLIPFVYKHSAIVAVSPSTEAALRTELSLSQPVTIAYNGVDHSVFKPGIKSALPKILYLGRLKKYKKIDDLLRAFLLLKTRLPEVQLIIAGSGEEREELENLAKDLQIQHEVFFEGFVSDERKIQLLQNAWVLAYPSLYEGWGISILEANACGTAAVGSNVSGIKDAINDGVTGLLFPLSDEAALADRLFAILTNASLRTKLETGALNWAKEFDWDKSYKKIRELITT